jgi:hypothetical protein
VFKDKEAPVSAGQATGAPSGAPAAPAE